MAFTIPAECHSDDHVMEAKFDALPFFEQAIEEDLIELVSCGFGGDYAADYVAQYMEDHDENVKNVFTYLGFNPRHYGETVGFECHVEEEPALAWIKANRPEIHKKLVEQDLIDDE